MVRPDPGALAERTPGPSGSAPAVRWVPLIVVGGAVGTAARAALEQAFPASPAGVPWVTLIINVAGSFLLGVLLDALARTGPDEGRRRAVRLTLGTGVLGGFTTYSTFMLETVDRLRDGHAALAVAYLVGSIALGLAAAGAGIATSEWFGRSEGSLAARDPRAKR